MPAPDTTVMSPAATVAAIYEAFSRGDVPTILGLLAGDVVWDGDWSDNWGQDGTVEHFAPRYGKDGVAAFFTALAPYTVHEFVVQDLFTNDRGVVARVVIDLQTPSGGRLRDEELHLWTLDATGRVSALRHYIDTAKHLAAARGIDTTHGSAATVPAPIGTDR